VTLDEYNAQPGMVTAAEWCERHGTSMAEMAEAQEQHEYREQLRIREANS
jgi:hypothetical protein